MLKSYVKMRLKRYVRRYFAAHPEVKLIAVTGSVGKTSTKRALGTVLNEGLRVRMDEQNHNTDVSAPLGILGLEYPTEVRNPLVWLGVFRAARERIQAPTDVDVIIQELGSDHPGDIAEFGGYLRPDIAVVTGVTPEHMEFFGTLDAVAKEELGVSKFSAYTFINCDDVSSKYADFETTPNFTTYGVTEAAEYQLQPGEFTLYKGYECTIVAPGVNDPLHFVADVVGEHSLRPIAAAVGVALKLGMSAEAITRGASRIRPVPGRMNVLHGLDGTIIIDDTYNSSPAAAVAALRTVYELFGEQPQRIAILGDMRELGETSKAEHEALALACDPTSLDWVVTVGPEMENYFAPMARSRGCQVKCFMDPILAAEYVRTITHEGAVILAKGSQNTIFLEEAVKVLCVMSEHARLVRQSPEWMEKKQRYFDSLRK